MMKMMLSIPCSLLLLTGYAHAVDPIALKTGTYALQGANPGVEEMTYSGTVTIVPQGDNYSLQWQIGAGQTQRGVGILSGNILSVAFYDDSGMSTGVVSYKLTQEGQLAGQWIDFGGEEQGQEVLDWQRY